MEQDRQKTEDRLSAIGRGIAASNVSHIENSDYAQSLRERIKRLFKTWGPTLEALARRDDEPAPRKVDLAQAEAAVHMLLEAIGEDLTRPDVQDTPARVAKFYKELIEYEPGTTDTSFPDEEAGDQMVTVAGVRTWSLCAHHMLPFYTDVSMGYIPQGRVLGLSKFARIAHMVASGLQTQERVATQIADAIEEATGSPSVAVICENGMHTCATMRGIKTPLSMNNAVMRGVFRDKDSARAEFYNLIQGSRR
jgi:GTP cyclohydrolase I